MFGGTFVFGGRRACQSHRCRAGQRDATAARCPLLAVAEAPLSLNAPNSTSLHPPPTVFFARRPTTMNDGAPVVTPASTLRLALPQAVERKRSAARLFSKVEGHASPFVVAPATAVQQGRIAPSSRSPRSLATSPPHLPAASLGPLRRAQADHGERRHRSGRVGHRGGTTTPTSLLAVSRPRRWPSSPPSTVSQPSSTLVRHLGRTTVPRTCPRRSSTGHVHLSRGLKRNALQHPYIQQCSRSRVDTLHRRARTSAAPLLSNAADPLLSHAPVSLLSNAADPLLSHAPVPLLSNAAVPLPSNAPVPFPSNAAICAQGTSVLVRGGQPQTRNAQQQRAVTLGRQARTLVRERIVCGLTVDRTHNARTVCGTLVYPPRRFSFLPWPGAHEPSDPPPSPRLARRRILTARRARAEIAVFFLPPGTRGCSDDGRAGNAPAAGRSHQNLRLCLFAAVRRTEDTHSAETSAGGNLYNDDAISSPRVFATPNLLVTDIDARACQRNTPRRPSFAGESALAHAHVIVRIVHVVEHN
ncbi:hypothetical protein BKA93DRAFT_930052 [Sparassis latifolia]